MGFGFLFFSQGNGDEPAPDETPTFQPSSSPNSSPNTGVDKDQYPDSGKIVWDKEPQHRPAQPTVFPPKVLAEYVEALFSTNNSDGRADPAVKKWLDPTAKKRDILAGPPESTRKGRVSTSGRLVDMEYKQSGDYFLVKVEMIERFAAPPTEVKTGDLFLGVELGNDKNGNPTVVAAQLLVG